MRTAVLVVEDDDLLRTALVGVVQDEGYPSLRRQMGRLR
jgi:hypothetical protein